MLNPNDTLLVIKRSNSSIWLGLDYYNPDSDSGGQIVDTILCMLPNKLKTILCLSETPEAFIKRLLDSGNSVLLDKGTKEFDTYYRILEHAFNGQIDEQDKKDYGRWDHYMTISTEETKDPDEYLLSVYAVMDRWGLFN
jgi:hypothetical protein